MDRNPEAAASQLPGRSPVLPDKDEAETVSSPVAVREPKFRFRRTVRGPGPVASLFGFGPGVRKPFGLFTKPAAFASAKGQARSFRMAAASSAARPSLPPACCLVAPVITQSSDEINIASNQIFKDLINPQPIPSLAEGEELPIDGLEGRFDRKRLAPAFWGGDNPAIKKLGKLKRTS
jgi:hypothetical protein